MLVCTNQSLQSLRHPLLLRRRSLPHRVLGHSLGLAACLRKLFGENGSEDSFPGEGVYFCTFKFLLQLNGDGPDGPHLFFCECHLLVGVAILIL